MQGFPVIYFPVMIQIQTASMTAVPISTVNITGL